MTLKQKVEQILREYKNLDLAAELVGFINQQLEEMKEALGDEDFDDPITDEHMEFMDNWIKANI